MIFVFQISVGFLLILTGCVRQPHSAGNRTESQRIERHPPLGATGRALYQTHCASCHRDFAQSNIREANYNKVSSAMDHIAAMSALRQTVSENDLRQIAHALSSSLDLIPPDPPTAFSATPGSEGRMVLTWRGAALHSKSLPSDLAGYRISRDGIEIVTLSAQESNFTDQLSDNQPHRYEIRAFDFAGNESEPTLSNPVSTDGKRSIARTVNTKTDFSPKSTQSDPYTSHRCAQCHGSLSASNLRMIADTDAGFLALYQKATAPPGKGGIIEMQNLSATPAEIVFISQRLRHKPLPNPPFQLRIHYNIPLGTYPYVVSVLERAFLPPRKGIGQPSVERDEVRNSIERLVESHAIALGGSCSRYDECKIPNTSHDLAINALQQPLPTVNRSAAILNICSTLLEGSYRRHLFTRAEVEESSDATLKRVQKLYEVFFPFQLPSESLFSQLRDLHANAVRKGLTRSEAWRLVALPLCETSTGGPL